MHSGSCCCIALIIYKEEYNVTCYLDLDPCDLELYFSDLDLYFSMVEGG